MNDIDTYIGCGLCFIAVTSGCIIGKVTEKENWEKAIIKKGLANYQVDDNKNVTFVWHTNLTQVKP